MNAEGWYVDPFEAHEARWFSDGHPTSLVRDGRVEGHDEPPSTVVEGDLVPWPTASDDSEDGSDLRRADDAIREDQSFTAREAVDAAQSQFQFNPFN